MITNWYCNTKEYYPGNNIEALLIVIFDMIIDIYWFLITLVEWEMTYNTAQHLAYTDETRGS